MVPHALYKLHPTGIHRPTPCRLAEIPAVVRMWRIVRTALDFVLWQYQGLERVDRCHLLLAHRILYGFVRADDFQEALFCVGVFVFADYRCGCDVDLLFADHVVEDVGIDAGRVDDVAGLICIVSLDARYRYGIMIGVVSSAVCALYAICNKKVSVSVRSRTVLMYQMSGGLFVVSAIIPVYLWFFPSQQPVVVIPDGMNLWFMLCHALFCTVGMYLLQIQALKRLSAFTVNLTYNLEPCYTIILAFLIFGEGREINFSFYLGIALILLSVFLQSMKAWRPN